MDGLDLFGAFESGETVDVVAPVSSTKKRGPPESEPVVAAPSKRNATEGAAAAAEEDESAPLGSSGGVVHTDVRRMEWGGRSVLTFSCFPEGHEGLEKEEDGMNTLPENPAKVYPFELDPFQKQSIA